MVPLPRASRDQLRLLALVLLLGLGVAFHLYLWNPRRIELVELEQRVRRTEEANAQAEARTGDPDRIREELELAERQFAVLQRLVPSESEVAAIYEAIASETQSLGLELLHVIPGDPAPDSAGYFLRQQWAMQVEGGYHDIARFLTNVAGFPRIVRPEVEEILPARVADSGRQLVQARFRLETFVLPPGEGGPSNGR